MKKKLFLRAGIGFLFGVAFGVLISVLSTLGGTVRLYSDALFARTGSAAASIVLQLFFSGLYGALCMGGTIVYEIEEWPLLRVTLTHFLICMVPYLPISLLLGWNTGLVELLIVIGVMTVIYFIIWLIMFLRYRAQVRELNNILQRRKAQETEPQSQNTKEMER